MDRKMLPLFFVVVFFSLASMLLFASCGIFGGGKEESKKPAEVSPAKPVAPSASQTPKPLLAAKDSSGDGFKTDALDYQVKVLNGSLNWSKGFISTKGYGVPGEGVANAQQAKLMAFRAAYAEALASLFEIVKGVQVTATTKVQDYVLKDYNIELKLEGIIKGAKEIAREFNEKEQTAVVEVGIAMEDVAMSIPASTISSQGAFRFATWEAEEDETLLQIAGGNEELVDTIKSSENLDEIKQKLDKFSEDNEKLAEKDEQLLATIEKLTKELQELKNAEKNVEKPVEYTKYTGVIINAAGSGITPCIAPNIFVRDGDTDKLLYGINDGRARDENLHALVAWEKTLSNAVENPRVRITPIIVNATYISKDGSAIAINPEDARLIEAINKETNLLENGKVIIVS